MTADLSSKKQQISLYVFLIILISVGVFHISTLREGHNWGGDFAHYLQHAKNISEGKPYAEFSYIYNPSTPIGPTTYPPVFPLLISPIYGLFGVNLIVFKIITCILFICFLTTFYFFTKDQLPALYNLSLIAVLGFNPLFWMYKDLIISEIPFLLFLYANLVLYYKAEVSSGTAGKRLKLYFLAGVFLLMTCGAKVLGLVLIPTTIIYSLLKQGSRKKLGIFLSIFISTVVVFLFIFPEIVAGILSYGNIYKFHPTFNLSTIYEYSYALGSFWNHSNPYQINRILSSNLLIIALIGFLLQIRKKVTIFEVFITIYFISLVLLPWTVGRFLIPVFPLLAYYTFFALSRMNGILSLRNQNILLVLVLVFIGQLYLQKYNDLDFGPIDNGVGKRETIELFEFIKKKTTNNDVIVFPKPRVMAFYTERKVLKGHWTTYKDLWSYFRKKKVSYIVVTRIFDDYDYYNGLKKEYDDLFELKFFNNDFRVYNIKAYD